MAKSFTPFNQPVFRRAGTVVAFLASALFAPLVAEASCSHLVTSRTDRHQFSAVTEFLMHDLAVPSDPLPEPSPPRPCSGAFCSGQPAVPAAPAGVFEGELESWACLTTVPEWPSTGHSFHLAVTVDLHPTRRTITVFHPPRLLPPA
jgi:hypothetical protein